MMRAFELNEATQSFQLFVDMDGVLVGFQAGVQSFLGTTMITVHNRDFWKTLHNSPEEEVKEWWANLEWAPGGKELWNYVSKFHPSILSAPDMNKKYREACEKGKIDWIQRNLRPQPTNIILQRNKEKTAHKFAILIDDKTKNTVPWEAAGGVAILHETGNAKKTIKELQERFGFPKK
ncbi:hypothetical protein LCGC14_1319150 [marine sediment metagenome]|uniref:FCP1 homology domain-containing protein n=1 Tax=marine sediment metagenome TaxID=412755 RepID=A0A0F9KK15_9ZZZZ